MYELRVQRQAAAKAEEHIRRRIRYMRKSRKELRSEIFYANDAIILRLQRNDRELYIGMLEPAGERLVGWLVGILVMLENLEYNALLEHWYGMCRLALGFIRYPFMHHAVGHALLQCLARISF